MWPKDEIESLAKHRKPRDQVVEETPNQKTSRPQMFEQFPSGLATSPVASTGTGHLVVVKKSPDRARIPRRDREHLLGKGSQEAVQYLVVIKVTSIIKTSSLLERLPSSRIKNWLSTEQLDVVSIVAKRAT